jgi:hypothetical protein
MILAVTLVAVAKQDGFLYRMAGMFETKGADIRRRVVRTFLAIDQGQFLIHGDAMLHELLLRCWRYSGLLLHGIFQRRLTLPRPVAPAAL